MIEQLKNDVISGRINYLKLIDTDIEVIKDNKYAMMFGVYREVMNRNDNWFSLKTYAHGIILEAEAYYTAFDYYDGTILKSGDTVYKCAYSKEQF